MIAEDFAPRGVCIPNP